MFRQSATFSLLWYTYMWESKRIYFKSLFHLVFVTELMESNLNSRNRDVKIVFEFSFQIVLSKHIQRPGQITHTNLPTQSTWDAWRRGSEEIECNNSKRSTLQIYDRHLSNLFIIRISYSRRIKGTLRSRGNINLPRF